MRRMWQSFYPLMIFTMLVWASTGTTSSVALSSGLKPGELIFYMSVFGLMVMLPVTLALPAARRSLLEYRVRHLPALLACGLLGYAAYNYFLFHAFKLDLNNIIPPLVVNYLWPITTLLFSVLLLRHRMTPRTLVAAAVAFSGLVIIQVARVGQGQSPLDSVGMACLLALGAAVSWGLFSALARRAADDHGFHPLSSTVIYLVIAIVLTLILHGRELNPGRLLGDPKLLAVLAVLGIGANGVANVTWLQAIRIGGPGRTTVVAYLTPVLGLTYAAIFLGQWPQWYALLGLGAILVAITLVRTAPQAGRNVDLIRRKEPSTG